MLYKVLKNNIDRYSLFALALTLVLAANAAHGQSTRPSSATTTPSNAQIVRNFDVIAFGNEYKEEKHATVRKWVSPVRIAIMTEGYPNWSKMSADYPDYLEDDVQRQIADLTAITGHPIELYFSPKMAKKTGIAKGFDINKATLYLFYLPTAKLSEAMAPFFKNDPREVERLMFSVEAVERKKKLKPGEKADLKGSTCFATIHTKGSEIRVVAVGVPAEHPRDVIRTCVIEELTQVMGLPNDSESVNPSIFNDRSPYVDLTEDDKFLLKILYDPRMKVGTPRTEVAKIAATVMQELRPGR